ncbi:hypothetical protein [Paucibacter soli]|uniref:hypothetical protein n=1 Tax=Paucibacter soli TaxID=3133433 RepID=UPI0030956D97
MFLRCIVILVHALLLCAAVPAAAQVLGDSAQPELLVACPDLADDGQEAASGDDALEAPELFAQWRPSGLAAMPAACPAGLSMAPAPAPYLEGPQRPPKAQAPALSA